MTILNLDQLGVPHEIVAEVERLAATYEFEKLADKGQNGYLFFAKNRVLDRRVAIKFYFWADGVRAHVEPKSLAAVQSAAIIEILEATVVGNEWALFVTPYYRNGDLDRFRESYRFGLREGLRFAESLLNGVSALHKQRFVHRDLKPENILVSEEHLPLIADFGSVRIIPEDRTDVPGSGHAVLYRPPESFSSRRYDYRGDVYQCGLVLFQVLGGRLSYDDMAYLTAEDRVNYLATNDNYERTRIVDEAIGRRAAERSLVNLQTLPFYLPLRVKQIIQKAINPSPQDRYQTASDMVSAVHTACNRAVDWIYEAGKPIANVSGIRYRLLPGGNQNEYIVQQDRGNGWRKVSGTDAGTRAAQGRFIEQRGGG
jgi:serine/threonine protein kinase